MNPHKLMTRVHIPVSKYVHIHNHDTMTTRTDKHNHLHEESGYPNLEWPVTHTHKHSHEEV